jgi:hypothetical protein
VVFKSLLLAPIKRIIGGGRWPLACRSKVRYRGAAPLLPCTASPCPVPCRLHCRVVGAEQRLSVCKLSVPSAFFFTAVSSKPEACGALPSEWYPVGSRRYTRCKPICSSLHDGSISISTSISIYALSIVSSPRVSPSIAASTIALYNLVQQP